MTIGDLYERYDLEKVVYYDPARGFTGWYNLRDKKTQEIMGYLDKEDIYRTGADKMRMEGEIGYIIKWVLA
jgi:hypothetical protein